MKALDIVKTPKGGIAFITETARSGSLASIDFIGGLNPKDERNAWWNKDELEVIDSIPKLLAIALSQSDAGLKDAKEFF